MSDESDGERIVRLETQQANHQTAIEQILSRLDSIDQNVGLISRWVDNKTGFIAGVMFCLGILAAAMGAFSTQIWKYLTGHQ